MNQQPSCWAAAVLTAATPHCSNIYSYCPDAADVSLLNRETRACGKRVCVCGVDVVWLCDLSDVTFKESVRHMN